MANTEKPRTIALPLHASVTDTHCGECQLKYECAGEMYCHRFSWHDDGDEPLVCDDIRYQPARHPDCIAAERALASDMERLCEIERQAAAEAANAAGAAKPGPSVMGIKL